MFRKRLTVVFASLALLAVLQGVFTYWATQQATHYAQRSLVAAQMLSHYLELGANKQRLKVWFAQATLTGAAQDKTRSELLEKMTESLRHLALDNQKQHTTGLDGGLDLQTIQALNNNFAALKWAVLQVDASQKITSPAAVWRAMLRVFDESDGKDMRPLLAAAVDRQTRSSEAAEASLAQAIERVRYANITMTILLAMLALFALLYFIRALQKPFTEVVRITDALAKGNLQARSLHIARDEFGDIGRSLNALAAQLNQSQVDNEQLLSGLEDSVASRTRALSQAHNELLDVDAKRKAFFAELSHELRTPVTVIRGEADVALRGQLNTHEYHEALERIRLAATELGERVTDLLQAARSGAFAYVLQKRPLPATALVISAMSQMRAVAHHQKIELVFNPNSTMESCFILADPARALQALMSVLDNALSYSPPHSIVTVSLTQQDEMAHITVLDQGMGFHSETQSDSDSILDPQSLVRSPKAIALRPEGAGLGLKIASKIMTAHHGYLLILAPLAQRQGAQVQLSFPLSDSFAGGLEHELTDY